MGSLRVASVVVAAAVGVLALAGSAGADSPTLFGVVGPGSSIRLSDASGNAVKHLDPGSYTIQIKDQSPEHDFHLTGPGIDETTDVEGMGTFTWTVTVSDGKYRFQCDVHPTTIFGTFTAGSAPPPPTPTTSLPPAPAPVKVAGSVGPGKRIAVTRAGAKVATLKAGAAVLVVSDRSATDNFHLTGPGVNRATTKAGKSTSTWKLTLKRGLYAYRSDSTASLKGSFRVS